MNKFKAARTSRQSIAGTVLVATCLAPALAACGSAGADDVGAGARFSQSYTVPNDAQAPPFPAFHREVSAGGDERLQALPNLTRLETAASGDGRSLVGLVGVAPSLLLERDDESMKFRVLAELPTGSDASDVYLTPERVFFETALPGGARRPENVLATVDRATGRRSNTQLPSLGEGKPSKQRGISFGTGVAALLPPAQSAAAPVVVLSNNDSLALFDTESKLLRAVGDYSSVHATGVTADGDFVLVVNDVQRPTDPVRILLVNRDSFDVVGNFSTGVTFSRERRLLGATVLSTGTTQYVYVVAGGPEARDARLLQLSATGLEAREVPQGLGSFATYSAEQDALYFFGGEARNHVSSMTLEGGEVQLDIPVFRGPAGSFIQSLYVP